MFNNDKITGAIKDKRLLNRLFVGLMCFIELLILGAIAYIIIRFCVDPDVELYNLIAMGIMLIWFGVLVAYYGWAVYFYNINLGLTNEDWAEIRERKKHSPEESEPERTLNPNKEETLGLPKGTIRGTLALTLMIGGLAMTIAALGMENSIKENTFLVDNFNFFKTAFLMMIAFYFGNKSLEMIGYKSKRIVGPGEGQNESGQQSPSSQQSPIAPSKDASAARKILRQGGTGPATHDIVKGKSSDSDFDYPDAVQ